MKAWIACVCCLALAGLAAITPREILVGLPTYLPSIRIVALAVVFADSRRLRLNDYAAGLGKHGWVFWLVMILWPIAAVPWYLTIREWIRTGRTPRRQRWAENAMSW